MTVIYLYYEIMCSIEYLIMEYPLKHQWHKRKVDMILIQKSVKLLLILDHMTKIVTVINHKFCGLQWSFKQIVKGMINPHSLRSNKWQDILWIKGLTWLWIRGFHDGDYEKYSLLDYDLPDCMASQTRRYHSSLMCLLYTWTSEVNSNNFNLYTSLEISEARSLGRTFSGVTQQRLVN